MRIIGIDPGTTGALAFYDPLRSAMSGLRWQVMDLPTLGEERKEIDARALLSIFQSLTPDHAFLEAVHASPQWGVMSCFQFGATFGAIKAILSCCSIPVTLVQPVTWKRAAGLAKGAEKEASRIRAAQLFPDGAAFIERKKDQHRAEAMLLARYGWLLTKAA